MKKSKKNKGKEEEEQCQRQMNKCERTIRLMGISYQYTKKRRFADHFSYDQLAAGTNGGKRQAKVEGLVEREKKLKF